MKRIITILFITLSLHAFSTVRLVPSQYSTIQLALNAAKAGDTILVSKGLYRENIIWPQTNNLHLISDISSKNSAIIDGRDSGRVINVNWTGSKILLAEINGFVIQHGFINVPAHQGGRGAGVYALNASLKIQNCLFRENNITSTSAIQNSGGGAALHIESTPKAYDNLISNCVFTNNTITEVTNGSGTAIELDNASATVNNITVSNNSMSIDDVADGTIYAYQSNVKINAAKIENNTITTTESILQGAAAIKGGGIFIYLSNAVIANVLIDNNKLTPQNAGLALLGSGIYFYGEGSSLNILNSTIANNIRTDGAIVNGRGVYFSTAVAKKSVIANSVIWNPGRGNQIYNQTQKASASYCDVLDGYNGIANINVDPQFISSNNYHLQTSSPCINIGNNKFAPAKDLDGHTRPSPDGTNADLGCYENAQNLVSSNAVAKSASPSIHVYPNPSKGAFKLSVDESFINSDVKLISASGETVYQGKIQSMNTNYNFDKLPNGVYHLIITNSSQVETSLKLVLSK